MQSASKGDEMKTPKNKTEALALLQTLEQDFVLLQDGDWEPDNDSCEASLEVVLALVKYVKGLK